MKLLNLEVVSGGDTCHGLGLIAMVRSAAKDWIEMQALSLLKRSVKSQTLDVVVAGGDTCHGEKSQDVVVASEDTCQGRTD